MVCFLLSSKCNFYSKSMGNINVQVKKMHMLILLMSDLKDFISFYRISSVLTFCVVVNFFLVLETRLYSACYCFTSVSLLSFLANTFADVKFFYTNFMSFRKLQMQKLFAISRVFLLFIKVYTRKMVVDRLLAKDYTHKIF